MQRPLFLTTLALVVIATSSADARPIRSPGRFGLGIGSGTIANGLSAKYFVDSQHALQFNLGSFGAYGAKNRWRRFGGFGVSADYLFEMPTIVTAGRAFDLAWNIGAGLGMGFDDGYHYYDEDRGRDYFALAASFVLGLEFNFIPIPLDIVLEFRPSVILTPGVHFDPVDFTGHIRGYF